MVQDGFDGGVVGGSDFHPFDEHADERLVHHRHHVHHRLHHPGGNHAAGGAHHDGGQVAVALAVLDPFPGFRRLLVVDADVAADDDCWFVCHEGPPKPSRTQSNTFCTGQATTEPYCRTRRGQAWCWLRLPPESWCCQPVFPVTPPRSSTRTKWCRWR